MIAQLISDLCAILMLAQSIVMLLYVRRIEARVETLEKFCKQADDLAADVASKLNPK